MKQANKQLLYRFISMLAILFTGMGLFPLLPVYAGEFGADSRSVGLYLAITYFAISAGSLGTDWMLQRIPPRLLFVGTGFVGATSLALIGQAGAFWQVILLTSLVWAAGGIGISIVSILTGLAADKRHRGKTFGLMFLATPLGAILGGLTVSSLVAWQGYPLTFAGLALVMLAWPLVGLRLLHIPAEVRRPRRKQAQPKVALSRDFHLLLVASLLVAVTISVGRWGISLAMQAEAFSPSTIAGTSVVGGLVSIPMVPTLSGLSDRTGRKQLLTLIYVTSALSAIVLIVAHALWQFWVVAILILVARAASGSVGSALATDLLPASSLGRGLPRLNTTAYVAGIVSYAGGGFVVEAFGSTTLFVIAAVASVGAMILLQALRRKPACIQTPETTAAMEAATVLAAGC